MVSTPSRSSAATRISLPIIVGPTSARAGTAADLSSVVVLFMMLVPFTVVIVVKEKAHDRCRPWAPVEIGSSATRHGGRFTCDDGRKYKLQRGQIHQHEKLSLRPNQGQARISRLCARGRVPVSCNF